MKAFKKLALVSAIAAAPFAQAEMVAIDDALMSEMTGQAGITIELSTEVKIGDVIYTDTDGLDNAGGSLAITGVRLGGATAGTALDNIKIDIDVDETDGLIIHLGGTKLSDVLTGATHAAGEANAFGDIQADATKSVDFGLDVASVSLNNGVNLVSNVSIQGFLGPIDIAIANDGTIDVDAYFEVTNGSVDVDVLGLGITNLTIGQDSSPILTSTEYGSDITNFKNFIINEKYAAQYAGAVTAQQGAAVTANAATITGAGDQAAHDYAVSLGYADEAALDLAADPTEMGTRDANRAGGELAATTAVEAAAAAGVEASLTKGVNNMAYVGMQITTGEASYLTLNGTTDSGGIDPWSEDNIVVSSALIVNITAMSMDIGMDLTMGSAVNQTTGLGVSSDLGSVVINDLDLSGTMLKIYGH